MTESGKSLLAARLARAGVVAVAVWASAIFTTGASCDTNGQNNPPAEYYPDKETFDATERLYAEAPVVETGTSITVIGHGADVTDKPMAETAALQDASVLAAHQAIIPALYGRDANAGEYFGMNPDAVSRALRNRLEAPGESTYKMEKLGYDRFRFDLYQTYILPAPAKMELIEVLWDEYRRYSQAPTPQDVEFAVVLANLQRSLSYEQKVQLIVEAVKKVMDDLSYKGEVLPLEQVTRLNPEELAQRKRAMMAQIAPGLSVEVSLNFDFESRERLKSIALYDTRGRKQAPIAITQHPAPVAGKYRYSIFIPSYFIKKGSPTVQVEVAKIDGSRSTVDYAIAGKIEYTDSNIGLLMLKGFDGHLQNLAKKLRESIRLPDENGNLTVELNIDSTVRLDGTSGLGSGSAGVDLMFRIGLYRPNATNVWYLGGNAVPDRAALADPQRLNSLDWVVVWRERDPEGKFGELNDIKVPGTPSRQLYVKIEYNGGRDFDVLLFDFNGRVEGDRVTEPNEIYSSRKGP